MENKYLTLESLTEDEMDEARDQAMCYSRSRQNYHCMLKAALEMYYKTKQGELLVEGISERFCLERIKKIFNSINEEPNISDKTKKIYRVICDFLIYYVDSGNPRTEEIPEFIKKYLE